MSDPEKPLPPRSIPPAPPPPELLRPRTPHVPLTPMMEFLQRRLESLEGELAIERERARAAQNLLTQQEALRGEVESQLKSLTENLRREKAERESEEARSQARGRIEALEKRLDEMHQSWVLLLREAIAQREKSSEGVAASQNDLARELGAAQAELGRSLGAAQTELVREQSALGAQQQALRQELVALRQVIEAVSEKASQWQGEARGIADVLARLRALAQELPADGRRLEGQLGEQLGRLSSELREQLASWQRGQELETQKAEERLQGFLREKAALERAWEEREHALRQETATERVRREGEVATGLGELAAGIAQLKLASDGSAREAAELRAGLGKLLEKLSGPPAPKEQIIAALELEKQDLMRALGERSESLQRYIRERREIEKTMGDSLAAALREADDARGALRLGRARLVELEAEAAKLNDELAAARRANADHDQRAERALAERDAAAKALLAESERVRQQIDERARSEDEWRSRLGELQQRLNDALSERARKDADVTELRGQLQGLSEQLARLLAERDAIIARYAGWAGERETLIAKLREKDEMLSMLNATFSNLLKK